MRFVDAHYRMSLLPHTADTLEESLRATLQALFNGNSGGDPDGWLLIGSVTEGSDVTVDGAAYDGPTGWTHF